MLGLITLLWGSLFPVGRRLNYIPSHGDGTDYTQFIITVPHTTSMATISETFAKKNIGYENITQNPQVQKVIKTMLDNNKKGTVGDNIEKSSYDWLQAEPRPMKDLFDIVILTGTLTSTSNNALIDYSGWLSFFESWKPIIENINVIIMQQGDPTIRIEIPSWLEYELYTKLDVQKTLGELAWIIDMNDSDSSSARSFAFMASDKDYIFVLDRFMLPMMDVSTGKLVNSPCTCAGPSPSPCTCVNVLAGHLQQLLTPCDPYYFNSFHDPYQKNNDFVRGYPYLLRGGALTGLSQGQPMRPMDFDAATQLIKPSLTGDDNRYHNHPNNTPPLGISQTVPHGMMFSLTGNNFAFHRVATAPIMYFLPAKLAREWGYNIGEKNLNILTGWMVKCVLDYVRLGVKSGGDTAMTRQNFLHDDSNHDEHLHRDYLHHDNVNHRNVNHVNLNHTHVLPSPSALLVEELAFDYTWIHCPNASLDRLHRWLIQPLQYNPYNTTI